MLATFQESGIPGEVVICREMLCEGRVTDAPNVLTFFEERSVHVQQVYGIDQQIYQTRVVEEFLKLHNAKDSDEIVLWFEFDLFCQINLLFCLHYLQQLPTNFSKISIVSVGDEPNTQNFKGLGSASAQQLQTLFEQRKEVKDDDIMLATRAWQAYCGNNPFAIEALVTETSPALPFLGTALAAHLQRLPNTFNGLNIIHQFFLHRLALGQARWYDLYQLFWNELRILGFGDFQLDIYSQRMRHAGVMESKDQMLAITSLGKEVLSGEENYLHYADFQQIWLGGIHLHKTPFRYHNDTNEVVTIDQVAQ